MESAQPASSLSYDFCSVFPQPTTCNLWYAESGRVNDYYQDINLPFTFPMWKAESAQSEKVN